MIYVLRGGEIVAKVETTKNKNVKQTKNKNVKQNKKTNSTNVKQTKKEVVKEIYKEEKVETTKISKKEKIKKIAKIVFDIVFWVAIVLLLIIWLTDFFKMKNNEEPVFCLSEKTHKFDDGTVYECKGLGYNIYHYDRESMKNAYQFSPFFVGMKK